MGKTKSKARRRIVKAMIELLKTESFDEITIKQICAESGVHRSTFYAQFEDKYQLFDVLTTYHMAKYEKLILYTSKVFESYPLEEAKARVIQTFRLLFKYMKRHQTFFTTIIVTQPQLKAIHQYLKFTRDAYEKLLNQLPQLQQSKYFINYTIGGELALIYSWLMQGCQESPDDMAQILYANIIKTGR
ncbi:TetR/AcrR family transcriptional regulator [Staphylococcus pseudintermedius]|uniref:TetR/AcrR family transcriptional regulator n=7 Tax=Staphylococcus pseudintermedius TaxID=283734 RepID=A0A166Q0D0_STAPS|nr:TetR/AcrR family transcriptional regulator [Staphylococcus pseudintermedius]ADV04802.1 TetR family regulatory protein of MDR cluster [Staphylococcus pseudintermedius HKU10-03]ADX77424.1 transcriptional regulator, TetR family [Staphylococcus pseudintermedius ED99]ANQ82742.1 TetR family transcriptional regulator [Staphylococcus pseudintermedius]ANQ89189.1 TetR family transcriptional regulator [Staphylococcus pseudintermedius]ANS90592.1 TetR family regulatory protein of MDR cluster [Staphyloco